MAEVVGGGMEERSHKDWVVRRMGEPAWRHLYRSYAERRWGLPSEQLSVSLARMYHGGTDNQAVQVVGGGYDQALEQAQKCLLAGGGALTVGQKIVRVEAQRAGFKPSIWMMGPPLILMGIYGFVPHRKKRLVGSVTNCPRYSKSCTALCSASCNASGSLRETRDMPMELHILDERASFGG